MTADPRNPNVPAGGRVPVTVTAMRKDDFDGPIDVVIEDMPGGLQATAGVIAPGQVSTVLLLSAGASATLSGAVPFKITGNWRESGTGPSFIGRTRTTI